MSRMYEFTVKIAIIADNEKIAKSIIDDNMDDILRESVDIQDYYITDDYQMRVLIED